MKSRSNNTISFVWLIAALIVTAFIWGNSLIPFVTTDGSLGGGSLGLSESVYEAMSDALDAEGLPHSWLSDRIVRKGAHVIEHLAATICYLLALRPWRLSGAPSGKMSPRARRWLLSLGIVLAIPCIDETIQLFTPGRTGQLSDVLLDCVGVVLGIAAVLLALCIARAIKSKNAMQAEDDPHGTLS